ncbi:hypothetical protein SAMN02745181_3211 [Rubritalea squalenifaciens DSM 18772]|uniref:Uncharacterized protein n=1 Tax=Rubritalea squalenifaciens DSM 18772 TaxID=1123071 RepID=A0A1M6PJR7_9BACT|nr:C4-type zinc ribbon domain-containing protein [Rubritalea squalenifaciens]SHK08160.1 hypothetical protein SAMN02745181_3211 [Rubritalea squalenifaciens DSM 18772]
MLPEVESLLVVQNRDQKIDALRKELELIPREKARAEEKLSNDTQAVATAKAALQENEVAIKSVELDISTRRNTIDRLKVQQFETKKNDEYTAIAKEIVNYTEMVDELETQELELMEKSDVLKEKLELAQKALGQTQSVVDEDIALLDQKAGETKKRLEEALAERETLVEPIDENLLALYDRLRNSKGTDPVAPLKGSQCGGCHMKVTSSTAASVQAEKAISQCENCGRILYAT